MAATAQQLAAEYRAHGDEEAAKRLYDLFVGEMLELVRWKLRGTEDRGALDSEGIVHSGFESFFSAIRRPGFDPWQGKVGGYLAVIVSRKVFSALRRRRLVSTSAPDDVTTIIDAAAALAEGKTTEQEVLAVFHEGIEPLLEDLTKREREIIRRFLDNHDDRGLEQIARDFKWAKPRVENVVDQFIARLRTQSEGLAGSQEN
jgi:RNA polymerase sigma factor (sigma-70 family)